MKKFFLLSFIVSLIFVPSVRASSQEAYREYLSEVDQYRRIYADFASARDSYLKFQTLTSQSDALNKTKLMLTSRNRVLISYLNLLSQKIAENPGLQQAQKQQYFGAIQKESAFIATQNGLVPAITSIDGTIASSKTLENHYPAFQAAAQKTILGLILGNLSALANQYDEVASRAQQLVSLETARLPGDKLATLGNWMLQINAKRAQFQQTVDVIALVNAKLDTAESFDLDRQAGELHTQAGQARQNLIDGASFLGELIKELKYAD